MATPKPGASARGSESGRPVMAILDLLGRRWTLRIGWELRDGPLPFRELQRRCDMASPNVVTTRLRECMAVGLIEKQESGAYGLTQRGVDLLDLLRPLDDWAKEWARDL